MNKMFAIVMLFFIHMIYHIFIYVHIQEGLYHSCFWKKKELTINRSRRNMWQCWKLCLSRNRTDLQIVNENILHVGFFTSIKSESDSDLCWVNTFKHRNFEENVRMNKPSVLVTCSYFIGYVLQSSWINYQWEVLKF